MRKTVFFEIVCIVVLAVFIVFIVGEEKAVTLSSEEICESVIEVMDTEGLQKFGKNELQENFGLDSKQFESFAYYGSKDVMNVCEVIVIKPANADKEEILSAIENAVEDKKAIFESYSPEAFALLKNSVIEVKNGVIFYCVNEKAEEAYSAFLSSIK